MFVHVHFYVQFCVFIDSKMNDCYNNNSNYYWHVKVTQSRWKHIFCVSWRVIANDVQVINVFVSVGERANE